VLGAKQNFIFKTKAFFSLHMYLWNSTSFLKWEKTFCYLNKHQWFLMK